ncbi:MAG: HAMP domain-containing histidine kinase [Phyllobacteriaceae bacterium]|nr:HAMP domain-containing histidine kinase [Phyllobacteriaceae bacterium]
MAETKGAAQTPGKGSLFTSLSGKVLLLTMVFVMLGEVLIFLPSIANYRIQWLKSRIAQAEIAALAAEAAPDQILNEDLRSEILKGAGVVAVSLKKGEKRQLVLRDNNLAMVAETFDLRPGMYYNTTPEALFALVTTRDRIIGVIDHPPNMSGDMIEIALHEQPLSEDMRSYGLRVLLLSVVLSVIVAAFIFAALSRVLVRPMQRLSANMTAFGGDPQNATRIITPSGRRDELGAAEHELHDMQTQLQAMLQQKSRLAALGLAVSKVSHDLRNMLTSAQLISDRLGEVRDPQVQRFAPKLISSLDRAIGFLNQTLSFGQAQEPPPQRESLNLHGLVAEVLESFSLQTTTVALVNSVPPNVPVDADREQLSRILTNLVRNALQAIESQTGRGKDAITISAERQGSVSVVRVTDTGPGIPEAIRDKVFAAFQTAARSGGTGLGLAISTELAEAHGGSLKVALTGPTGTTFTLLIPDQPTRLDVRQNRRSGG